MNFKGAKVRFSHCKNEKYAHQIPNIIFYGEDMKLDCFVPAQDGDRRQKSGIGISGFELQKNQKLEFLILVLNS